MGDQLPIIWQGFSLKQGGALSRFLLSALFLTACLLAGSPSCAKCLSFRNMVLIPPGWFVMGDNSGRQDERPAHRVWLDAYYIDKYEVTFAQYAIHLNAIKADPKACLASGRMAWPCFGISHDGAKFLAKPGMENLPVSNITFKEAQGYCRWLGKELPSEAQWEKAARAGLAGSASSAAKPIAKDRARVHTWFSPWPAPVGAYPANAYGVHDMLGNVQEFCRDFYHRSYYRRSPDKNPLCRCPNVPNRRVVRGGSYSLPPRMARLTRRFFMSQAQGELNSFTGFRCVCAVGEGE